MFLHKALTNKCRRMSTLSTFLRYNEFGEPLSVLECLQEKIADPKNSEVLVKILASPINPADINTIQGKYPDKPKVFPAVPGNECVAQVLACGPTVKNIKVGDHIIPFTTQSGTWRTHSLYDESKVLRVPKELGLVEAATITVNPPTAYRMLRDFVDLKPGDTVIQNGANSAVGQAVIQLCRIWGINCVSIVRNRPDLEELSKFLKGLGSTAVLTEEECRVTKLFKENKLPSPRLAFNCVGGKSSTEMTRHIAEKGVLVTYGAMSREPVTAPNAALIFKDISFRGFWMSRWSRENADSDARREMLSELVQMYLDGKLKGPAHQLIPFAEYRTALAGATDFKGFAGSKFVLDFNK